MLSINKGLQLSPTWNGKTNPAGQRHCHPTSLTGNSALIRQLREQIERVAPTDAWVLIRGGHGTGKELVAQTIHRHSAPRANGP